MKPHWYRITVVYCPICMKETTYRKRVYGKKPKTNTHEWVAAWDGCNDF